MKDNAMGTSTTWHQHQHQHQLAVLAIRSEGAALRNQLRVAAAAHGRSMEKKVRIILRNVLAPKVSLTGLVSRLHARFAALGDLRLTLPGSAQQTRAASFERVDSTA